MELPLLCWSMSYAKSKKWLIGIFYEPISRTSYCMSKFPYRRLYVSNVDDPNRLGTSLIRKAHLLPGLLKLNSINLTPVKWLDQAR